MSSNVTSFIRKYFLSRTPDERGRDRGGLPGGRRLALVPRVVRRVSTGHCQDDCRQLCHDTSIVLIVKCFLTYLTTSSSPFWKTNQIWWILLVAWTAALLRVVPLLAHVLRDSWEGYLRAIFDCLLSHHSLLTWFQSLKMSLKILHHKVVHIANVYHLRLT